MPLGEQVLGMVAKMVEVMAEGVEVAQVMVKVDKVVSIVFELNW